MGQILGLGVAAGERMMVTAVLQGMENRGSSVVEGEWVMVMAVSEEMENRGVTVGGDPAVRANRVRAPSRTRAANAMIEEVEVDAILSN